MHAGRPADSTSAQNLPVTGTWSSQGRSARPLPGRSARMLSHSLGCSRAWKEKQRAHQAELRLEAVGDLKGLGAGDSGDLSGPRSPVLPSHVTRRRPRLGQEADNAQGPTLTASLPSSLRRSPAGDTGRLQAVPRGLQPGNARGQCEENTLQSRARD